MVVPAEAPATIDRRSSAYAGVTSIVVHAGGGRDGKEGCARALLSGSTATSAATDAQRETAEPLLASSVGFTCIKANLQVPDSW